MQRVSVELRARLGEEAARDLEAYVEGLTAEWRDDVMHAAAELCVAMAGMRADLQAEMLEGFGRIWQAIADLKVSLRQEIANTRVEILRWSFLFWISEVAVLASLLAYMLRGVAPR